MPRSRLYRTSRVYDLRKKRRETGSIAPREYKRGAKLKLAPYEKEVRMLGQRSASG